MSAEAATADRLSGRTLLLIGIAGGFASGLLGVGGGTVMVPLLVLVAHLSQRWAHAVSLAAIIPISIAGALAYGAFGELDLGYAIALAAGAMVGARAGAILLSSAPERPLQATFGVFMCVVAVLMVLR